VNAEELGLALTAEELGLERCTAEELGLESCTAEELGLAPPPKLATLVLFDMPGKDSLINL